MSGPRQYEYVRDPAEIYRLSFAQVREETDFSALPESLHDAAIRLVHACGMPEIVADIAWSGDPAAAVAAALRDGATVITDVQMVAEGIIHSRLPSGTEVICTLNAPGVPDLARASKTTRSAAAVELWDPWLANSVVVIGNAPTALFRLLERLSAGAPRPAAILAFPVGFVGARESKDALVAVNLGVPFITLLGRRGGSAIAAAALNALATRT